MSISLYITNSIIQVVEGTRNGKQLKIERMESMLIPPECMYQGEIDNEELFTQTLKTFIEKNHFVMKNVSLIVRSKDMATRGIQIPTLSSQNAYEYIEREFAEFEEDKEYTIGYFTIGKSKIQNMLNGFATSAETQVLDTYLRICSNAGIKIKNLSAGYGNIIHMLSDLDKIKDKTCIVQICERNTINNILFIEGIYNYSSSTRIDYEHGSVGYAFEVAKAVSRIFQFMQAHQIEIKSIPVYMAGFDDDDMANCVDSIYQMNSEADVVKLALEKIVKASNVKNVYEYMYAASGLLQMPVTNDMLLSIKKNRKKNRFNVELKKMIMPPAVIFGILLIATIVLAVMNIYTSQRYKDVSSYNNSAAMLKTINTYDTLYSQSLELEKKYEKILQDNQNIASYPVANKYVENIIKRTADKYVNIEIISFDALTGVVNVETTADNVEKINVFIDNLRKKDIFVDVDYTGYTFLDQSNAWQINVVCYLAENAGEE